MPRRVHYWTSLAHQGCPVCRQFVEARHASNVRAIARVAASLRLVEVDRRQGGPTKQETPGLPGPEVSTAHTVCDTEVRAAGAQSDTRV